MTTTGWSSLHYILTLSFLFSLSLPSPPLPSPPHPLSPQCKDMILVSNGSTLQLTPAAAARSSVTLRGAQE